MRSPDVNAVEVYCIHITRNNQSFMSDIQNMILLKGLMAKHDL